jgi:hypothetical protein
MEVRGKGTRKIGRINDVVLTQYPPILQKICKSLSWHSVLEDGHRVNMDVLGAGKGVSYGSH